MMSGGLASDQCLFVPERVDVEAFGGESPPVMIFQVKKKSSLIKRMYSGQRDDKDGPRRWELVEISK